MTNKELKSVVDFYNNVILQQIIKPVEIVPIYKLVKPQGPELVPHFQKMRAITVFVQGLQQNVLDDLEELFEDFDEEQEKLAETNNPMLSTYIPPEEQSHSEDPIEVNPDIMKVHKLETELEELKDIPENKVRRTSLKRQITVLNKKINGM